MRRHPLALLVSLVLVLAGLLGSAGSGSAAPSGPALAALTVYQPSDEPLGTDWPTWAATYNEWFQEIPIGKNPLVDPNSKRNCEVVDGMTMFSPAGTGKGCTVATDKPILIGLLGWTCSTAEGNGRTWKQLTRCAKQNFKKELTDVNFEVTVDGVPVDDVGRWTFLTAHRVIDFPKHNLFSAPAGPTKDMGKGIYLMLEPPAAGDHVVRAEATEDGRVSKLKYRFTAA